MLFFSNSVKAGEKFCVLPIFDKYGYGKGVTMLEASKELLKQYKIKQFKSIIFEDGTEALPEIRACIEKDKVNAEKIKEVVHDGSIMNGFYRLKTATKRYLSLGMKGIIPTFTKTMEINHYLIFKVQDKKVTLIYVEGALTTDELVELLK
jgi:hypothetical protein